MQLNLPERANLVEKSTCFHKCFFLWQGQKGSTECKAFLSLVDPIAPQFGTLLVLFAKNDYQSFFYAQTLTGSILYLKKQKKTPSGVFFVWQGQNATCHIHNIAQTRINTRFYISFKYSSNCFSSSSAMKFAKAPCFY